MDQPMNPAPSSSAPAAKPVMSFDPKDVQDNKVMAALSYIGLLVLIPLLAKKESKFAQEHAKQGLALIIAWVILWVVGIIPILGWIVGFFGSIILLILNVIALIKALMGQFWEIPVIGPFRHKLNL
jgi:uncharacterized membrane protein